MSAMQRARMPCTSPKPGIRQITTIAIFLHWFILAAPCLALRATCRNVPPRRPAPATDSLPPLPLRRPLLYASSTA